MIRGPCACLHVYFFSSPITFTHQYPRQASDMFHFKFKLRKIGHTLPLITRPYLLLLSLSHTISFLLFSFQDLVTLFLSIQHRISLPSPLTTIGFISKATIHVNPSSKNAYSIFPLSPPLPRFTSLKHTGLLSFGKFNRRHIQRSSTHLLSKNSLKFSPSPRPSQARKCVNISRKTIRASSQPLANSSKQPKQLFFLSSSCDFRRVGLQEDSRVLSLTNTFLGIIDFLVKITKPRL